MGRIVRRFLFLLRRVFVHSKIPAVEYALLLSLVVLASTAIFHEVGPRVRAQFLKIAAVLKTPSEWR